MRDAGSGGPPLAEVRGSELERPGGPPQRLDAEALAPLVGTEAPLAARSPDGATLAYNTFSYTRTIDRERSYADQGIRPGDVLGRPRIRLRDLTSGRERALEPGSEAPAWRSDGALAYVVGSPPEDRADEPFLTHVVVRPSGDASPSTWTTERARYTVLGWAGQTLLVSRGAPGAAPDILAFDAPMRTRTLAQAASLLAIAPDGKDVVVADAPADTPTPRVRRLRVADGTTVGATFVADARDPVTNAPLTWILGPGSWVGGHVVAAASSGLVVLSAGDGLSVEQVIHVDSATKPDAAIFEPRFADDDARTIVAWSAIPGGRPVRVAQLVCDRVALTCTRSAPQPAETPPRPVAESRGGTR
jgi:hypothetical protein